jgi:hypothetical protein
MSGTDLDISSISPKAGARFSPNLHAWVKKHFHGSRFRPKAFMREKDILIGYVVLGDFTGSSLSSILAWGAKTQMFCLGGGHRPTRKFRLLEDFWPKYVELGRCHIDPGHVTSFVDKRWDERPRKRTCLWCGHVQRKVVKRRTVVETVWVSDK